MKKVYLYCLFITLTNNINAGKSSLPYTDYIKKLKTEGFDSRKKDAAVKKPSIIIPRSTNETKIVYPSSIQKKDI